MSDVIKPGLDDIKERVGEETEGGSKYDPVKYFKGIIDEEKGKFREAERMNINPRPKAAEELRSRLKEDENSALSQRLLQGEKGEEIRDLLNQGYNYVSSELALDLDDNVTDLEFAEAFIEDELDLLKQELENLQKRWDEVDAEIQDRQKSKNEEVQNDREEYNKDVEALRKIKEQIKEIGEDDEDRERKLDDLSSLQYNARVHRDGTDYGKVAKISKDVLFQIYDIKEKLFHLEKIKANIPENK